MGNLPILSDFSVYVCSRNSIVAWAIECLLAPRLPKWRMGMWPPQKLAMVPQGIHTLLIDVSSVGEWPEVVRRWISAGHRTILLVDESWASENAELRALHLGVRAVVQVSEAFLHQLTEAIQLVANGQLFASSKALEQFYGGSRRLRRRSSAPYLSLREEQVIGLVLQGFSNRRIGAVLGISERTAKFHVCNILRKLQATNRRELADRDRKCVSA